MTPQQTSPWLTRIPDQLRYPKLTSDLTTEIVVVGGGIAGVTAAYFLTKAGKRVALLEGNHLGTGETGFTTAFLIAAVDPPLAQLREQFGDAHIRAVWQTGTEAINLVEATVAVERLACDFRRLDAFEFTLQAEDLPHVEQEAAAIAAAGGTAIRFGLDDARAALGTSAAAGAIRLPQQGAFDVRKFLFGLAERTQAAGGQIYEETRMMSLTPGTPVRIQTASNTILADRVVLATGLFPNPYKAHNALFRPMVTYVIALGFQDGTQTWKLQDALYADFGTPFHYMRFLYPESSRGVDGLFFIGGEDRATADATKMGDAPWQALEAYGRTFVPDRDWEVTHRWRGQILETADALPVVGVPQGGDSRIILASGFGGNGMTFGTYAGKIAADLITGTRTPEENPFRFERNTLQKS